MENYHAIGKWKALQWEALFSMSFIRISEPQLITWSRILESMRLFYDLPVRLLNPLCSLTLLYNVHMFQPKNTDACLAQQNFQTKPELLAKTSCGLKGGKYYDIT